MIGGVGVQDLVAAEQPLENTRGKQKFHLSLASYSLHAIPLDKALAMTSRVGLKAICLKDVHLPLDSTPDEIAKVVAKFKAAGIDVYACGGVFPKTPADVEQMFIYSKAAGMRVMIIEPEYELLPLIDAGVKKYDIRAAIHNHGPGDIYPKPSDAYERIKGLDSRVGICIDIGHTTRAGADPSREAEFCADRLFEVHIKDVTAATVKGRAIEVGRGVIDIPRFLRTLEKIGYANTVSFEYEKDPDDPLPGLAESVGYVRGVLAAI